MRIAPTLPIASNPRSKKSRTPRKMNAIPKPARPTPISEINHVSSNRLFL